MPEGIEGSENKKAHKGGKKRRAKNEGEYVAEGPLWLADQANKKAAQQASPRGFASKQKSKSAFAIGHGVEHGHVHVSKHVAMCACLQKNATDRSERNAWSNAARLALWLGLVWLG